MVFFYIGMHVPLASFVLTGFVNTVPKDLDEAALIDGCTYFEFMRKILLPLMKPPVAMVMMLISLSIWNDFVHPYLFLTIPRMRTLTSGLFMLKGEFYLDLTVFAAAIV